MTSMKPYLLATAALAAVAMPAAAQGPAEFFKGKTITINIGFPPGGGYDANARMLARHFGKHVPGNPNIVAANMPGAGSLVAANTVYNTAPKDGTALVIFAASVAVEAILGNPAIKFDPLKYNWLGSMAQEVAYCGVWQKPGVAGNWAEVMQKETIFGGGAPAAITSQHPTILKNVLGAKIKVIPGYRGTADINLAMQKGEVNGGCGMFGSSIKSQWSQYLTSGQLKLVLQMGASKSKDFGDIPAAMDFAKSEDDKAVLEIHFGQLLLSRPVAAPPGVPDDRIAALRTAFDATMKDAEFLAESRKAGLDIDPVSAADALALLKRFAAYPRTALDRARAATK
jgi:tripartite-type tricarboxylate transporter receptor subunit TctC